MELFCPKNEQLAALTRLEGMSWYQAKDSVEDYINWFQELIDKAEYNDDKTIVITFHKGLDPAIQNKVALTGNSTPDFDDLESWYEATQKIAWNWEANEAFVESSRGIAQLSRPPIQTLKAAPSPMYVFGLPQGASFQLLGQPKQQVDVTQANDGNIQSESIEGQLSKGSHLMMGISKEKSLRTHHQ